MYIGLALFNYETDNQQNDLSMYCVCSCFSYMNFLAFCLRFVVVGCKRSLKLACGKSGNILNIKQVSLVMSTLNSQLHINWFDIFELVLGNHYMFRGKMSIFCMSLKWI